MLVVEERAVSVPEIATLTVMRGELDRMRGLLDDLAWASEHHLVETGSDEHPRSGSSKVHTHYYPLPYGAAFDAARGTALPHIRADWVLIVDTDERIPRTLVEHLQAMIPTWERDGTEGVFIARRNHVLGRRLERSSAWPDYQLRLFRTRSASFGNQIHSFAPKLAKEARLAPEDALAIQHFNFESTKDFVAKLNLYSDIEVDQSTETAPPSPRRALYKASREFLVRYLRMRGYADGAEGLHYAVMLGIYRYLIESKRWERVAGQPSPFRR